jgi:hypothetical protein
VIPTVTAKIAVTAAGLVLAGTAVAAALGSPPEAADKGLATAEEHTGFPVPVAAGRQAEDDELGDDVVEDAVEGDDVEDEADDGDGAGGPVDNHGAAVSAVAKDDTLTGREHGQAVSEVARSDAGKPVHDEGDDEVEDEGETDERPGNGAGQGNGHGNGPSKP